MKIFVSYRRDDSRDVVVPLCDRLGDAFGDHNVFRDEDTLAPGSGFMGGVIGGIYTADLILVAVGPRWLTVTDSRGRRRIDDKDDAVRMEVGGALASRRPTIPLLVHGAAMPSRRELPRDIRNFASLSALSIPDGPAFHDAVDGLIAHLGGPRRDPTVPTVGRRPRRNVAWTSFEGRWQTPDGMFHEIVQQGDDLELNSAGPAGFTIRGVGQVSGNRAMIDCIDSGGGRGRLVAALTPDGAYLQGQWSGTNGTFPIQLMRR
ncbi:MAG: toll/interleukin-1 receptor domain-containing protein [Ilumatobacter sp.]|uniref:toll/interleukin-1 receptor domain-containing protein n=1 Tax=Ilumatobacter sp. TaxID=1967498 RepID=UPI0026045DE2|nr:toll/interleukin-1 receptor domain-containing protein [Ilumatobacter sp.]MDJ0770724.1 toll/interleukin-1 receptor domain-containing protein [Ilumatobacter sp.]